MKHSPSFWHQHHAPLARVLSPVAWLYQRLLRLRQRRQQATALAVPVICIGNVIAGGAGKTPTVLALTRLLQSLGHRPQIVTRGYGGKATGPVRVTPADDWRQVGDEPKILSRQTTTWVAKNRLAGCLTAVETGAELLICDDGFQDRRLEYHTRLLVMDGPYGLGNGLSLPAGPLREPWEEALLRADAVLVIGEDPQDIDLQAWAAGIPCFHARLTPEPALSSWLKGRRVAAFAGLGRPEKFRDTLTELGADLVIWQPFPDHHPYQESDLEPLFKAAESQSLTLVTTEKDAAKLPPAILSRLTVLPVTLQPEDPDAWRSFWQQSLEETENAPDA